MNVLKKLAMILVVLALVACSKENPPSSIVISPVNEDVIVGLMACTFARACAVPTTVEVVNAEKLTKILVKDPKFGDISYFFTDKHRFGVSARNFDGHRVLLEDNNLDGFVDRVTFSRKGESQVVVFGAEDSIRYRTAQELYRETMKTALKIVPPEFMKQQEERKKT